MGVADELGGDFGATVTDLLDKVHTQEAYKTARYTVYVMLFLVVCKTRLVDCKAVLDICKTFCCITCFIDATLYKKMKIIHRT